MLQAKYAPAFSRDLKKKAARRRWDLDELAHVIDLICENSPESVAELKSRHNMHALAGQWRGSLECHVANAGDWLLIWAVDGEATGSTRSLTATITASMRCAMP